MGIFTKHYQPSMIGKVQFFFETMDSTHDCEMFLSDDRQKRNRVMLKDEYIPAMVLKKLLAHTKRRRYFFLEGNRCGVRFP
jgi:hypothetical protein